MAKKSFIFAKFSQKTTQLKKPAQLNNNDGTNGTNEN